MISHMSIASTVYAVNSLLAEAEITVNDVGISYLPAAHAFERGQQVFCPFRAIISTHFFSKKSS